MVKCQNTEHYYETCNPDSCCPESLEEVLFIFAFLKPKRRSTQVKLTQVTVLMTYSLTKKKINDLNFEV